MEAESLRDSCYIALVRAVPTRPGSGRGRCVLKRWFSLAALVMVLLASPTLVAQTLTADKLSLTFTSQVGGPPTSQPVNVTSNPSGAIIVATPVQQSGSGAAWLSVSPNGGATPVPLAITVDPSKLSIGTYTGSVVVSVLGGSGSVTIAVSLTVSSINVFPASLTFETSVGNTPLVQSLTMTASQQLTFTAAFSATTGGNWLQLSPTIGTLSPFGAITALPDSTVIPTLAAGTYRGTILITPTSGTSTTPVQIPVTLTIQPAPAVTVSANSIGIVYQINGTANISQKTLTLTTPASQGVSYTIQATTASGGSWLTVAPASGTITTLGTALTIGYNPNANLAAGTYTATVTINTPTGAPTRTDIPVTLLVSTLPLLSVPHYATRVYLSIMAEAHPLPSPSPYPPPTRRLRTSPSRPRAPTADPGSSSRLPAPPHRLSRFPSIQLVWLRVPIAEA